MPGANRSASVSGVGRPAYVARRARRARARKRVVRERRRASRPRARRAPGSASRGRSGRRTRRRSRSRSRRLHERAHRVVILDPRASTSSRELGVDRPRADGLDRLARRSPGEAAGEHRRGPARAAARSQWPGSSSLPRQVERRARPARRRAGARRRGRGSAVLALVELDEVGAPLVPASPTKTATESTVVGDGEHASARARALRREDEAGEVGARLGRDGDVLLARQAADLHERPREQLARASRPGRARASAPSRRGSRRRRRARPRRPGRACGSPLSAIDDRGRAARARRARAARRGRSRRSRGRAR